MRRKKGLLGFLRRIRIPKPLIQAVIGIIVLALLFIGGGIAYVYFGPPDPAANTQEEELSTQYFEPSLEGEEPPENATVGVSVQSLTSPVPPGSNATFGVSTLRGATCEITVEYDDVPSQDSGLIPKTADNFGMVSWTWTVEESVPLGEWPIEVLCSWNAQSGMVQAKLDVSYDTEEDN